MTRPIPRGRTLPALALLFAAAGPSHAVDAPSVRASGAHRPAAADPAPARSSSRAGPPRQSARRQRARQEGDFKVAERLHEFYFTRAIYSTRGLGFGWRSWATDFPKADRQFVTVIGRTLELLDLHDGENAVRLDDPELRRFPFLYALEVGSMALTPPEVEGLRSYLRAGGFLVVDDFWGSLEWRVFEEQMRRIFPGRPIVELSTDHPIFHTFYDVDEILQVPNVGNARRGGPTHERDGFTPRVRGVFDEDGRLMVVINWNTDLGDAWEWSEQPFYPFRYSTYAYKMGVNFIVYAMTH